MCTCAAMQDRLALLVILVFAEMTQTHDLKADACAAASQAIELLGGPVEAARKVEAPSYQAVQSWRGSGVPVRFCRRVAELTGMGLDALRPADWHEYWGNPASLPTKEEV